MAKDIIVALDFPTREETTYFLYQLSKSGRTPFVKIGMELFYAEGPSIIREIKEQGCKIFLDLKLHDIPNTVGRAMSVLSELDVDMVNLHAAGGSAMMEAAVKGLTRPDGTRPLLIAVTQLTSTDDKTLKNELLIDTPMAETVLSYAENARRSGLDGVVCSPLEAALIKERCGKDFCTVTPGIRFADGDVGDQKRVQTPAWAAEHGCDYIVMGRPITQAEEPAAAYWEALEAFQEDPSLADWLLRCLTGPGAPPLSKPHLVIHVTHAHRVNDGGDWPFRDVLNASLFCYPDRDDFNIERDEPEWDPEQGSPVSSRSYAMVFDAEWTEEEKKHYGNHNQYEEFELLETTGVIPWMRTYAQDLSDYANNISGYVRSFYGAEEPLWKALIRYKSLQIVVHGKRDLEHFYEYCSDKDWNFTTCRTIYIDNLSTLR